MEGLAGWLLVGIAVMLWFKFLIHSGQISYTLWLGFRHISVHASETFGTGSSAHLGVRVGVHPGAGDRVESGAECLEEGCRRVLEEFGHGVGEDVSECMVEHFGA